MTDYTDINRFYINVVEQGNLTNLCRLVLVRGGL